MSYLAEKANAARWLGSARVRRKLGLSEPDAARLWGELEDSLVDCRSDGSRELAILEWKADLVGSHLLHAPLERTSQ